MRGSLFWLSDTHDLEIKLYVIHLTLLFSLPLFPYIAYSLFSLHNVWAYGLHANFSGCSLKFNYQISRLDSKVFSKNFNQHVFKKCFTRFYRIFTPKHFFTWKFLSHKKAFTKIHEKFLFFKNKITFSKIPLNFSPLFFKGNFHLFEKDFLIQNYKLLFPKITVELPPFKNGSSKISFPWK